MNIRFGGAGGRLKETAINILNTGEEAFKHDLQQIYEGVQAHRAEMLGQVRELQLAAQLLLAAESERIARQAPADPRAAALALGARGALARAAALDAEIDIAAIRVPILKKTEAMVHGRVTDAADRSAGPVTVTLADEQGQAIPGVEPVEVDSAGYYALVVPPDKAAALGETRLRVIVSSGVERVAPEAVPITLKPGSTELHDLKLNQAELEVLKVRAVFDTRGAAAEGERAEAPEPPRSPSARKRK